MERAGPCGRTCNEGLAPGGAGERAGEDCEFGAAKRESGGIGITRFSVWCPGKECCFRIECLGGCGRICKGRLVLERTGERAGTDRELGMREKLNSGMGMTRVSAWHLGKEYCCNIEGVGGCGRLCEQCLVVESAGAPAGADCELGLCDSGSSEMGMARCSP